MKHSGDCPLCGIYREFLAKDHIVPRWKFRDGSVSGNPEEPSNIQYICDNCHADKTRLDVPFEKRSESSRKIQAALTPEQRSRKGRHAAMSSSPERRSEIAHNAAVILQESRTPEQRRESTTKARLAFEAIVTPEQRSEYGHKAGTASMAALTSEQRSELGRKGAAAWQAMSTHEQRSEIGRKGAVAMNAVLTTEKRRETALLLPLEQRQANGRKAGLASKAARDLRNNVDNRSLFDEDEA